eukprot:SAG31_NODE_104_length_25069_cov_12.917144_7_plen_50_part_00
MYLIVLNLVPVDMYVAVYAQPYTAQYRRVRKMTVIADRAPILLSVIFIN